MVELRGFEPLTFSLRTRRATNCATAPCARRRDAKIHERFGAHPIALVDFHACGSKSIPTPAYDPARGLNLHAYAWKCIST